MNEGATGQPRHPASRSADSAVSECDAASAAAIVHRACRVLAATGPSINGLLAEGPHLEACRAARARGYFTPDETEALREWFVRLLTTRIAILECVEELRPIATANKDARDDSAGDAFAVGYVGAGLLVALGRHLVYEIATHRTVQRKLNEADPARRLPRKQYTRIYRSLTKPRYAFALARAVRRFDEDRAALASRLGSAHLSDAAAHLPMADAALRIGFHRYARARLRYRWHSYRRRRASAVQHGLFAVLEGFGRLIAEARPQWRAPRISAAVRTRLVDLLQPGDIIVTRYDAALSNLLLPGFWPHVSLHVGLPDQTVPRLGLPQGDPTVASWIAPRRVLEARKDGVLYRPIEETLSVDAACVLRPDLDDDDVHESIRRAIRHAGKLYDFDFDFFRDDCLVCTEVVYRAYEGVGGLSFPLTQRSGRPTLSAEDLVDAALEGRGLRPIALCGAPGLGKKLLVGDEVAARLRRLRDETRHSGR
ncbi:MAG: YiiX/YebB-like N1pC/P60 family cysteine hydrolase [Planctomycetota bacterium]